ncbi:fumarylacetoacetate hydrolase family protein [Sandaracinobacteroides hominis]|uniref:fumarylacetoacetate hydrolase family protein n=1 Tax=Sandaracinobacteroides hominis TaxID=2780086 RepID=UPI0018F2B5E0|nr:fumarylacetoacetate hydrolase family protein [Sandaracinobacteroides hominis]
MTWFPQRHARIFCAAVNYAAHRDEMGRGESGPNPMIFLRTPQSLVRAGEPIVKPVNTESLDWEGELALVIGKPARHVSRENALSHVASWTAFMDGSVRDWQRHTAQFTGGKNFDASGSIGPELVPAEAFGDYKAHSLTTRVNGEVVQHTSIDLMLHDVEALIAYISAFTELQTGDIIATGTCGGVGEKRVPPKFLMPGDVVEVDISGLPLLSNPIVAERG